MMLVWLLKHRFVSGLLIGLAVLLYPFSRVVWKAHSLQSQLAENNSALVDINRKFGTVNQQSINLNQSYGTCLAALRMMQDKQHIYEREMAKVETKAKALRRRIERLQSAVRAVSAPTESTDCAPIAKMGMDAAKSLKSFWGEP